MKVEKPKTDRDVLRDCWGRWTAIVALFAQGHPAARRFDPCAYADLRRDLIAVCRSLAQADGPERRFYTRLEEIVKPWLYLREFEQTDRENLAGLLLRCREAEGKLSGTKPRAAGLGQRWLATAIIAGAAVIGGLAWLLFSMADLPVLYTLRDSADTIWLRIDSLDVWQKASAIALIVVVASIFIVSRSAKK